MGRASRAVVPVLLGLVGAGVGLLVGLAAHWYVVEPSDDELRAVAESLTPAGFTPGSRPVVSGAMSILLKRGVMHFDATTPASVTLGEVAEGLRADGWVVRGAVDPSDVNGEVVAERDGLVASVVVLPERTEGATTASVKLGRGPKGTSFGFTVAAGALVGAAVAVGAVAARRRKLSDRSPGTSLRCPR